MMTPTPRNRLRKTQYAVYDVLRRRHAVARLRRRIRRRESLYRTSSGQSGRIRIPGPDQRRAPDFRIPEIERALKYRFQFRRRFSCHTPTQVRSTLFAAGSCASVWRGLSQPMGAREGKRSTDIKPPCPRGPDAQRDIPDDLKPARSDRHLKAKFDRRIRAVIAGARRDGQSAKVWSPRKGTRQRGRGKEAAANRPPSRL